MTQKTKKDFFDAYYSIEQDLHSAKNFIDFAISEAELEPSIKHSNVIRNLKSTLIQLEAAEISLKLVRRKENLTLDEMLERIDDHNVHTEEF